MQTKLQSLFETLFSILIGFLVALGSQLIIFPQFGIHISMGSNLKITGWFTLVSIIRGYYVRRFFNWLHSRGTK